MHRSHQRHTTTLDKAGITVEEAHRLADYSTIKQTVKKLQKRKARKNNKVLASERE